MANTSTAPAALLPRPRLERLLEDATRKRLTAITGGAGTGKTTLLSQWVGRRLVAWHTITPGDSALSVLVRGIFDQLRLQVPDLSTELLLAIEGARGPDSGTGGSSRSEALAAALCQDLDARLSKDLLLVLDDVHFLDPDSESVQLVASLCRNAPRRLHVVTASRDPLPFATSRMRIQGEATEVTADQLHFTLDEVAKLLEQVTGERSAASAEAILTRTGGWPVAVVLAIQVPDLGATAGGVTTGRDDTDLFEYLAEEVIGLELPEDLAALRKAAELPWITPEMAKSLGFAVEGGILFDTSRGSIYATRVANEPGAVTLSPLVRDFLLARHPLDGEQREVLLREAAVWYEEQGELAEAMEALLDLGAIDEVARILRDRGDTMLAAGMARLMVSAIERIPAEDRDRDVLLYEAEARQTLGDWEGATACYEALAPDPGDLPARLAWRLGFLSHMRGDVSGALDIYRRGRLDEGDLANEAALLGWTASAHFLRGERDQAQELANQALDLARRADDSRTLATAHTVLAMVAALDGDRTANDVHYLRALEHAERARDVVQTIRIRSNRGSHFLEEGDYDNALAELEIALRLADMTGFQLWRAMALSNRAQVLHSRGLLEEAVADLDQARLIFRGMGSALESYPLAQMGDVYALRGDTALARTAYEDAIRLAEEPADQQALVPARSGLARVLAREDPERAALLAESAAAVTSVIGHVRAVVARGEVALASGSTEAAIADAATAEEQARARRDLPSLAEALELEAAAIDDQDRARALLTQARSVWEEISAPIGMARVDLALARRDPAAAPALLESVASRLRRLGAKGLALESRRLAEQLSQRDPAEIAIRCFGGFSVLRSGQAVPGAAWQSRVAREIVGMLVANRGRPLHREVIIDRLWPEDDPAKAANRLSVALSTIRSVFDPDRDHDSDHYLRADRETVAIDLDHVEVDVELFFEEARRGRLLLRSGAVEQGLGTLLAAESRYVGEFLEEQPYADWATGVREEARSEFIDIASTLAEAEAEAGEHDAAGRWYLRILEQDAYNEPAHLALIASMVAAGRHGAARRLYASYVTRMSELEVEPTPFPAGH